MPGSRKKRERRERWEEWRNAEGKGRLSPWIRPQ
jgi:hypothetical protein